jgi:RNA polymerase sigma factor (sigma-70 family)
VRLEEWSGDLAGIPGQLTKLSYAAGQLVAGTAASARRKTKRTGAAGSFGAGESAIAQLERSDVIAALQALPVRQREALVLRYYGELSEAQIAKMMEISKGAVKSYTARGMSSLHAVLEDVTDHRD